jgi:hypothetical protein
MTLMHRTAWLAGLALFAGCLDVSSPRDSRRVALNLVPNFAVAGPLDGSASDVDSFVIQVRNPPFADTTLYIRIPAGQDEIRFPVHVTVETGPDTVSVTFDGYSSVTGLRLYSGTLVVPLVAGVPSGAQEVPVTYVGPGQAVEAIAIAPGSAALQPGGTVQFTYAATDTAGLEMPDDSVPVTFISRNTSVVEVGATGAATARRDGQAYVLVRSVARSSIRDSALVTVASVAPAVIGLSPASITVNDTAGTADPANRTVDVTNAGGGSLTGLTLGTIQYGAGATGWLTAQLSGSTAPATVTLQFDNNGLAAGTYTATVPVQAAGVGNSPQNISVTYNLAQGVASIRVTPGFAVLRPGNTQLLVVTARDAAGGTLPATGVTFASRSTGVATVNPLTGTITAVGGGTAVIVATFSASIADSLVVAVAANGVAVVSAISNSRYFDVVSPGDTARITVTTHLAAVAPEELGSYNAQLDWSSARLTFASGAEVAGGFTGTVPNTNNVGTGQLRFGAADPNGHPGPNVALYLVKLVAASSGAGNVTLTLTDLSAAQTFVDLLPAALVVTGVVRVP